MKNEVDELRAAVGAETDIALAARLGLERSTVAQWRRRGGVPARYRFMIDPAWRSDVRRGMKQRDRRLVYGDGPGEFLLRAALAVIPQGALDAPHLSPALLGDLRESTIINVVAAALEVCAEALGKARPDNEEDYDRLVDALCQPPGDEKVRLALMRPALGERD